MSDTCKRCDQTEKRATTRERYGLCLAVTSWVIMAVVVSVCWWMDRARLSMNENQALVTRGLP